jgi:hypothetical protein
MKQGIVDFPVCRKKFNSLLLMFLIPTLTMACMSLVQMKPIQRLCLMMESLLLTVILVTIEAGIPLTHQPMDSLCRELPGLLGCCWNHSITVTVMSLSILSLGLFSVFLSGLNTWKSQRQAKAVWGMFQCPPAFGAHYHMP